PARTKKKSESQIEERLRTKQPVTNQPIINQPVTNQPAVSMLVVAPVDDFALPTIEEAEGYFANKAPKYVLYDNLWKDYLSPAIYLANMEELSTCTTDPEEESLDKKLEKNLEEAHFDE
ncbi:33150_t:CDS:2, partial [Gigaspora margarita]